MWGFWWNIFTSKKKTMTGIDVSHHNGMIDWYKVANENEGSVQFVFLKATEGSSYTDTMLKYNSIQADREGLKISYYHFATLNTGNVIADAAGEADFFVNAIKSYPKNHLPLILDIETNKAALNKDQVLGWINAFFSRMAQLGHPDTVLYSYTPFLDANLPINHGLGGVKLWIAAYTANLKLPKGWAKEWLWQYSAKGSVKGINGNVDMNKSSSPLY